MAKVQQIDKTTVHRICSGQVVLSLAVAVKELVENGLDSGATNIEVKLKNSGIDSVEVADNGCGISENDFETLALKHYTSKISNFEDVASVATYGFRGEALSSLCALSDLTVVTCCKGSESGTKLVYDHHGKLVSRSHCSRQVGTTVTVSNLFSTLPVRHKEFVKNIKKELQRMLNVLTAYALISEDIRISCVTVCESGKTTTMLKNSKGSVRDNLTAIFGAKQLSVLLDIPNDDPSEEMLEEFHVKRKNISTDFSTSGFISTCAHGLARSTTDRQFVFINKRPCDFKSVTRLVNEIFHQFNRNQYPFLFLDIRTQATNVDVNVTPDKRQLMVENENFLLAKIKTILLKLYKDIPSTFRVASFSELKEAKADTEEKELPSTVLKNAFSKLSTFKRKAGGADSQGSVNESVAFKRACSLTHTEIKVKSKQPKLDSFCRSSDRPGAEIRNDKEETDGVLRVATEGCEEASKSEAVVGAVPVFTVIDLSSTPSKTKPSRPRESPLKRQGEGKSPIKHAETPNDRMSIDGEIDDHCEVAKRSDIPTSIETHITYMEFDSEQSSVVSEKKLEISLNSLKKKCELKGERERQEKSEKFFRNFRAKIDTSDNNLAEEELSRQISKEDFSKMEIIGQFNLGFIITKLRDDLFIVDQHATDEIYNFEDLQVNTVMQSQKLVMPKQLELTCSDESLLIDNLDVFRKNGFEFQIDNSAMPSKRVRLTTLPFSKGTTFGPLDVEELLFLLQDCPNPQNLRPSKVRAMLASRACRKSVMIGQFLNRGDMRRLVNHMGTMDLPWNCPHGRPTMRHLIDLRLLELQPIYMIHTMTEGWKQNIFAFQG